MMILWVKQSRCCIKMWNEKRDCRQFPEMTTLHSLISGTDYTPKLGAFSGNSPSTIVDLSTAKLDVMQESNNWPNLLNLGNSIHPLFKLFNQNLHPLWCISDVA